MARKRCHDHDDLDDDDNYDEGDHNDPNHDHDAKMTVHMTMVMMIMIDEGHDHDHHNVLQGGSLQNSEERTFLWTKAIHRTRRGLDCLNLFSKMVMMNYDDDDGVDVDIDDNYD